MRKLALYLACMAFVSVLSCTKPETVAPTKEKPTIISVQTVDSFLLINKLGDDGTLFDKYLGQPTEVEILEEKYLRVVWVLPFVNDGVIFKIVGIFESDSSKTKLKCISYTQTKKVVDVEPLFEDRVKK